MTIESIKKAKNLAGKIVLLRCDFNVPLQGKQVIDDYKLISVLPTIKFLQVAGAKIVLLSHLGRPEGKVNNKYSLQTVAALMSKLLDQKVLFLPSLTAETKKSIRALGRGELAMLENLRFYSGEQTNNKAFAKKLSALGQVYVNDAFAVSHRHEASVAAIKQFLPAYAGLLLEKEILNLNKIIKPKKPFVVIIGGAKIKTKIALAEKLSAKADQVLLGGALANTILAAKGLELGKSLVDQEALPWAKKFIKTKKINNKNSKFILPTDLVVKSKGKVVVKSVEALTKFDQAMDIGPDTILAYAKVIKEAKTIVWNGPVGKIEDKKFRQGTLTIARLLGTRSSNGAFCLVGGGDIVSGLKMAKVEKYISWVSTGGGASLAYLAGEDMPGLKKIVKS